MDKSEARKRSLPLPNHARNLLYAAIYLFFISSGVAAVTRQSIWVPLAVISAAATGLSVVFLLLLAQRTAGTKQFGIASIFLLVIAAGIYLAVLRWIISLMHSPGSATQTPGALWVGALLFSIPVAALASPIVIFLSESLIWGAVAVVRLRPVQRWLRQRMPPKLQD